MYFKNSSVFICIISDLLQPEPSKVTNNAKFQDGRRVQLFKSPPPGSFVFLVSRRHGDAGGESSHWSVQGLVTRTFPQAPLPGGSIARSRCIVEVLGEVRGAITKSIIISAYFTNIGMRV
jgi:hypothetical protein